MIGNESQKRHLRNTCPFAMIRAKKTPSISMCKNYHLIYLEKPNKITIFAQIPSMSPRALLIDGYDYFFYSREEKRKHIHVEKGDKEAKFWMEPRIEIAYNLGFTTKEILKTIIQYERIINKKWDSHFHRE